jgi:cytochrome c553
VRRMTFLPPQRQHGWAFRSPAGAGLILPAAVLALSFSSPAAAQGNVSKAEADAKLRYCEVCHGVSAQGFHGYYPIPRLAGQPTEYLKNQLQAFVERRRTSNIMFNVGHVLSPAMIDALTTDFNELNPKPLGGAPCSCVCLMPRSRSQGERAVSAPGGPTVRLHHQQVDQLGEGARTKSGPTGYLGSHAADRA